MGPLIFAAALYVEEILDVRQREIMHDESLQPFMREICRIHVVEEARHIRYAREELARTFHRLPAFARAHQRFVLSIVVWVATRNLIHPQVYAAVGLDPREARRAARRNPHWRDTQNWAARKVASFFGEVGLIGGAGRLIWKRLGLLSGL
jgi:hypothetical protein